jgi:hypothetical protein
MIDPELTAVLDLMPGDRPVRPGRGAGRLRGHAGRPPDRDPRDRDARDRGPAVPGWEGDPDVACGSTGRGTAHGPVPGRAADPRRRLHHRQRRGRARRRRHDGHQHRRRRGLGRVPPGPRAPVPGRPARLLQRPAVRRPTTPASSASTPPGWHSSAPARAAGWPRRPPCWPGTSAGRPCASRCCTSPSSTTAWRRRRCRPSSTRPSGTGRWPCRAGGRTWAGGRRDDVSPYAAPARAAICPGSLRPTSRRPRTTPARRGHPLRAGACCRPGSRSSCTSFPAPFTARRWWPRPPSPSGPSARA